MTTHGLTKPNRLFRGFLIVSLGIHAFILWSMADVYGPHEANWIEFEMQPEEPPRPRDIPEPPRPRRTRSGPDLPRVEKLEPAPFKKPEVPAPVLPAKAVRPSPLEETIAAREMPAVSNPGLLPWNPPETTAGMDTAPDAPMPAGGSPDPYFAAVRMRIEHNKHYPAAARRRKMHGRVLVRFVIELDGTVSEASLAGKSKYRLLNKAALDSVNSSSPFPKPPAGLFDGPVSVEIGIVFELKG